MYAVVTLQGHQFIVKKGDTLVVDLFDANEGETIELNNVLMLFSEDGETVNVGTPKISGATVKATIQKHQKGKKLRVLKFQGKKRYQRIKGFRPHQTVLSIDELIYG